MLTGIMPWPTLLAAAGLALIMVGATVAQARVQNYPLVAATLLFLALTLFVAYGRLVS